MDYKLTFCDWRDGLQAGKFLGLKCADCGAVTFPPRKVCGECGSENLDIVEVSGKGSILSYTICYAVPEGFPSPSPIALVELEEGCHIMANIQNTDAVESTAELIGQKVEMSYKEIPGDFLTGGDNRYPMTVKIVS